MVGRKLTTYFELVKPLIEFKFDMISERTNNVFELATTEEVDKLGKSKISSEDNRFTDEINLEEVGESAKGASLCEMSFGWAIDLSVENYS